MMKPKTFLLPLCLEIIAALLLLLPATNFCAQTVPEKMPPDTAAPDKPAPATVKPALAEPAPSAPPATAPTPADRAVAYCHMALASTYEDEALETDRPEYVTRAIDEYKTALNADPSSPQLNDGLADLYLRTGRIHDAEITARALLKNSPTDVEAHKLLGKIYLRRLSDASNSVSSTSPSGNTLDQAIAEYEKIVALEPRSVEDRMVLGQLYTVKHDSKKAEEEFKTAQAIEPDSEEVVLNLARLYAESSDLQHAAKVIEDVPEDDRTPKMELALGAAYDQLKRPKDAIAAYKRANEMEPGDPRTLDALAEALLNDNQFDEALKQFKTLADADPENAETYVHIARSSAGRESTRTPLPPSTRRSKRIQTHWKPASTRDCCLTCWAAWTRPRRLTRTSSTPTLYHANGAYTSEEKNNRGIFLERLGSVYHEQNKADKAIATYQKMIDLGGDSALRGYQGQVDTYRDAKQFDKAIEVSRKAVASDPKNRDLKLMLAGELADQGNADEGLALAKGLLDNSDNDRTVWLALGQMNIRLRRWKDAEDAFDKAAALTTKKEDKTYLVFLKGELAERQKHFEPAEQFFRQVLELDPANAMTLNYLGYMLADKGVRLPEALKMIRKAVELEPMNGAYLDSLGWVYFKMGEYELAEDNLRQAVERDQTDPTVHDHLGDLYEKTGRIRLAAAQWELSLAEYAKSAPADVEPGDVAKVQKKLESARVRLAKQEATPSVRPSRSRAHAQAFRS